MDKAVVLLSGGLDSTVTIAQAIKDCDEVFALHAGYGQLTETREFKAFENVCKFYNIKEKLIVNLDYLKEIGGSSLTDKTMIVETGGTGLENEIPDTYVPFRNGNLLAIASSLAEVKGASRIYIGAVEEDSSGYPDCRKEFFDAFIVAVNLGNRPETNLSIHLPLIDLSKKEIVELGIKLGAPLKYSWSCYTGIEKACGICDSCILRLKGFKNAGQTDPIPYEN